MALENLRIRKAAPQDFRVLVDIKADACLLFGDDYVSEIPFTREEFDSFQEKGNLFVAVDRNDTLLGYSGSYRIERDFFLYHLFVARKHAGKGIGSHLLQFLESVAIAERVRAITLITSASAPWNGPFYEGRGFIYLAEKEMPSYLAERWKASRDYFSSENPIVRACPKIIPRVAMEKRIKKLRISP